MTTLSYKRHGVDFAANVESMSAETIAYLLQYGWSQSLQDSVAGRAKAVREEVTGKDPLLSEAGILEAIRQDEVGTMQKRMDAILANTIGARVGMARDPLEVEVRRLGRIELSAAAKKAQKKLPKKEAYNEMLGRFIEANRATLVRLAETNLANKATFTFDLGGQTLAQAPDQTLGEEPEGEEEDETEE